MFRECSDAELLVVFWIIIEFGKCLHLRSIKVLSIDRSVTRAHMTNALIQQTIHCCRVIHCYCVNMCMAAMESNP